MVLIGHGSDYFLDEGEGRRGLLHNRKRAGMPPGERLSDLARRTLHAAALLEKDLALTGKVRFATDELLFRDQRPPGGAQHATRPSPPCAPSWRRWPRRSYGAPFELTRVGDAKALFAVRITGDDQPAAGDAARARRRPARSRRVAGSLTWEET